MWVLVLQNHQRTVHQSRLRQVAEEGRLPPAAPNPNAGGTGLVLCESHMCDDFSLLFSNMTLYSISNMTLYGFIVTIHQPFGLGGASMLVLASPPSDEASAQHPPKPPPFHKSFEYAPQPRRRLS